MAYSPQLLLFVHLKRIGDIVAFNIECILYHDVDDSVYQ